jgi:dTDP-glucose pyrophosphorylase
LKAVVMAGGEGTRLRPLTCKIPKPMVPVMDKPVMEYSLDLLKKHGIKTWRYPAVSSRIGQELFWRWAGPGDEYPLLC